jgi:hypothetical protein
MSKKLIKQLQKEARRIKRLPKHIRDLEVEGITGYPDLKPDENAPLPWEKKDEKNG